MSRPEFVTFTEESFTLLFQTDQATVLSALLESLSPDVEIVINGEKIAHSDFVNTNVLPFHQAFTGKLEALRDLNIHSPTAMDIFIAQHANFVITRKADNEEIEYHATTLVQVGTKPAPQVEGGTGRGASLR